MIMGEKSVFRFWEMRKVRLLFVNGHLKVGGVEMALVNLLNSLNFDKYSVDLLLLQSGYDYEDEIPKYVNILKYNLDVAEGPFLKTLLRNIKERNWFCVRYRLLNVLSRCFSKKVLKYLLLERNLQKQYDIAVAFRPGICADITAYAIKAPKKLCWWHHGSLDINIPLTELKYQLEQFVRVIAVSEGVKTMLAEAFPSLALRLSVIPNIVDRYRILRKAGEYNPYDNRGNEVNNNIRIVSVSRLSPEKNVDAVVDVAKNLKERGFKFQWFIVGDGECASMIQARIFEYGLESTVYLAGQQINPFPWIKGADIMVHLSPVESFGLVLIEAMVLKTFVIAVESIGAKELINQQNGVMVENDIIAIANAIFSAISQNYKRESAINSAYSGVDRFYSDKVSRTFNNLIDSYISEV